jgi:calcium-dependent protein kinase
MIGSEDNKVVRVCFNSKKYDKSFDLTLPNSINSLKRLKDCILNNIKSQGNIDKIKIFNYKGIEIDEADIDYLGNGQMLFLSLDGGSFSILNYINEYDTVKSIKSGGYGKVYLAKHVLTGKLVAIKQSNVTHLTNDEIYNISREAIYLESFKHKNIIRCYNSFSYESNFYMVMQYAEGGELGHYLEEKRWLTEKEAKQVFSQIVDALLYIHLRSVIHRDLKPNNILFIDKERKNIAIIDFGISGYACGNVQEKVKAGTLKFVPPEVSYLLEIIFYIIFIFLQYFLI